MERLLAVEQQMTQSIGSGSVGKQYLHITDNRNGKKYEVKLKSNRETYHIVAKDVQKMKDDQGRVLRIYDPAYMNTISATSKISYIDGNKGVLEYRGIPIEQVAAKSTFLETAYLLIFGELPSQSQYGEWKTNILNHTYLHTDIRDMMKKFRFNAHPMGMIISTISALSTVRPQSNPALAGQDIYKNIKIRNKEIYRIIGQVITIAANAYRSRIGRPFNDPNSDMDYVENFLYMMDRLNENYKPHPKLVKALDVLFILHADHELNCSTSFIRHLASSGVDLYTTIAGASAALYGPKHGGANEAVLRMLEKIGDVKNIPQFIEDVKNKKQILYGFGHRIYKNFDPRAKIVKQVSEDVFEVCGKEPLVEIAIALEQIALKDEYFIKRKLYPNVDFYSGVIYRAMGFTTDFFICLFAIPRVVGWIAHWVEFQNGDENNISRPRQNYVGNSKRDYINMENRKHNEYNLEASKTQESIRRDKAESQ